MSFEYPRFLRFTCDLQVSIGKVELVKRYGASILILLSSGKGVVAHAKDEERARHLLTLVTEAVTGMGSSAVAAEAEILCPQDVQAMLEEISSCTRNGFQEDPE